MPAEAEQQFCCYLEFRLNRLRQQATWSDKINAVTICSHRSDFAALPSQACRLSFTLGSLEHDLLYTDSPFWHLRNVTCIPACKHVCVRAYISNLVSFQLCVLWTCWYLFLDILPIPAPSSGYSTHWPVSWNDLPMTMIFQYKSSQTQSDKKWNNRTSKVGQSAQPSHWHFPLPGFVAKLIQTEKQQPVY